MSGDRINLSTTCGPDLTNLSLQCREQLFHLTTVRLSNPLNDLFDRCLTPFLVVNCRLFWGFAPKCKEKDLTPIMDENVKYAKETTYVIKRSKCFESKIMPIASKQVSVLTLSTWAF